MNRNCLLHMLIGTPVPRASGDEPDTADKKTTELPLFPAPAGMNRGKTMEIIEIKNCSPRQRG